MQISGPHLRFYIALALGPRQRYSMNDTPWVCANAFLARNRHPQVSLLQLIHGLHFDKHIWRKKVMASKSNDLGLNPEFWLPRLRRSLKSPSSLKFIYKTDWPAELFRKWKLIYVHHLALCLYSRLAISMSQMERTDCFHCTIPFDTRDLNISGAWYSWGVLKPIPHEHQGTTLYVLNETVY